MIAGVAILYVSLVGMVEAFDKRFVISETLSLGSTLILFVSVGMGYFTGWKLSSSGVAKTLVGAAIVGVISGVIVAMLVLLNGPINIREVLINASPALMDILTFSQESEITGLLMLTGVLVVCSVSGAAVYMLPRIPRRMFVSGLSAVLLFGMLEELLNVNILGRSDVLKPVARFLFGRDGLSIPGAIVIFLAFAILSGLWATQRNNVNTQVKKLPPLQQQVLSWLFIAIGVVLLLFLPQATGSYITQIAVTVGLYILMGLGLNIEIGLAGLLDLGFVGFFAIGAYTVALLNSTGPLGLENVVEGQAGAPYVSFWAAIPIAIIVSTVAGVFLGIPVLRMRGDYLAIVTLGFAEIIRILVLSDFLRPLLGGAQGILNIPKPEIGFLDVIVKDPAHFYYLIIIGCLIIAFVALRLQNARVGRNWMAIREDEDVAEAMGIDLIVSKLLAFGIGAGFAGLSGAIFAAQLGSVFPHSFALLVSINVLCLIIVGGMGSIPGVIVGSLVLVGLPELLREFSEFRLLIYGALLVVMMLVKPEGFWPSEARRRELQKEEEIEVEPQTLTSEPGWEMRETIST
jgi:branched-chain amino acid transport system permease protein